MSGDGRRVGARALGRLAVLALAGAVIWLGPFYRQVLGGSVRVARPWVMYRAGGLNACDVRWERVAADGTVERVDRFAVLGQPRQAVPPASRVIRGGREVDRISGRLCAALGPDARLRVRARCFRPAGWRTVRDGDACAPGAARPAAAKAREARPSGPGAR